MMVTGSSTTDVFGPQVAVAVDDLAAAHALRDQPAVRFEKAALGGVDAADQPSRQSEARIEQDALVVSEASLPIGEIALGRNENGVGAAIECDQRGDHAVELPGGERAAGDGVFERAGLVEPAHDHQPVGDLAMPAEREPARRLRERHNLFVDIGRQPAVERQFGAAGGFALRQRRIIEIGKAHRLLQLVDFVAGEKNPRHVGLLARHLARAMRISLRPGEEGDLVGERRSLS